VVYCSIECQKVHWKEHKPFCYASRIVSLTRKLNSEEFISEWRKTLSLQGEMDELMVGAQFDSDSKQNLIHRFIDANHAAAAETRENVYLTSVIKMYDELMTCMEDIQHYHDKGTYLYRVGCIFLRLDNNEKAEQCFQSVRNLGEMHGFFTMECLGCVGLGRIFRLQGQKKMERMFYHNATVACDLLVSCDNPSHYKIEVLRYMIESLMETDLILAGMYFDAMKDLASQWSTNRLTKMKMIVMIYDARMHMENGRIDFSRKEMTNLFEIALNEVAYVSKWRGDFEFHVNKAKEYLHDIWDHRLDKPLALVTQLL